MNAREWQQHEQAVKEAKEAFDRGLFEQLPYSQSEMEEVYAANADWYAKNISTPERFQLIMESQEMTPIDWLIDQFVEENISQTTIRCLMISQILTIIAVFLSKQF